VLELRVHRLPDAGAEVDQAVGHDVGEPERVSGDPLAPRQLRVEPRQALARDRNTYSCVCPGAVDTAVWARLDTELGALHGLAPGEAWNKRIAGIPLGRPEKPEDVAGVVALLAGPDSDYMTGQAIKIDGGLVMGD